MDYYPTSYHAPSSSVIGRTDHTASSFFQVGYILLFDYITQVLKKILNYVLGAVNFIA